MKITSIRAVPHGAHEVVTIWIDGKNAGSLVVGEGEGAQLVALLKEAGAHAATKSQLAEIEARYTPLVTENDELREKLAELKRLHSQEFLDAGECTPAERAVLDELANAKIVAACNRGVRCCAKFEEPYEKYVCSKELARRGEKP